MKRYLAIGMVAVVSAGCIVISSNKGYHPPAPPPPQVVYMHVPAGATTQQIVSADLKARIDAAGHIVSFTERDAVLSDVARSAAGWGDVEMTKAALAGITQFTKRDDACEAACLALAQRGCRAEAIGIAQTMTQFPQRDRTLRKLAAD